MIKYRSSAGGGQIQKRVRKMKKKGKKIIDSGIALNSKQKISSSFLQIEYQRMSKIDREGNRVYRHSKEKRGIAR